jgi:hypothetical protein
VTLTVVDYETGQPQGQLVIGGEGVGGDTPLTASMAEAYMTRIENYDEAEARAYWDGWSNGYLIAQS